MRSSARSVISFWGLLAASAPILFSCSDSDGDGAVGPERGQAVFLEPQSSGNSFACATCHAISEPSPDGLRRPGHPIGDMLRRSTFKNGELDEPLAAVNTCLDEWMSADQWDEDSGDWLSLVAYLEAEDEGSGEAPEVDIDIVMPPDDLDDGDAEVGRFLFNETCVVCHGEDAVGTKRGPPLNNIPLQTNYIARRVRLSGPEDSLIYDGLAGGRMPFWSEGRLSQDELRDIVAFLMDLTESTDAGGGSSNGGDGDGDVTTGSGRTCDKTHPLVGSKATLITRFHGVEGTATIVDDCTIELSDFHFDGGGIIVEVYSGLDGDFESGFALSDNLVRSEPYVGENLVLELPEGRSLDELDSISIWCVDVAVSFGDGVFE